MFIMNELGKLAVVTGIALGVGLSGNSAMASDLPPVGVVSGPNYEVVKARALVKFRTIDGRMRADAIEVVLDPATQVTFDASELLPPVTIRNDILHFGHIALTAVTANDLTVCGVGGDEQCTRARIRTYTTGVAGAGFWNAVGGYGAPLSVEQTIVPFKSIEAYSIVGLGSANAAIMTTLDISLLSTLTLNDFYPGAFGEYDFRSDFTNAGAGTYSTEIVMEVVLDIPAII